MCTLEHHRQMANFLLRSLEVLDAEPVTEEERREADDRFSQGMFQICRIFLIFDDIVVVVFLLKYLK